MSPAELVVLGSGSFDPSLRSAVRNPSGYALVLAREVLLFDFGFGNLRQLARAGIDPLKVTHAFFTHRHPDHVGDLPALLFHFRYAGAPRAGLRLYGPRGFAGFCRRLARAHHPWLGPRGYALSASELEEGSMVRGRGWKVLCREVPHSTEALAFRVQTPGGSLCYSGDTSFDEKLARFASGADLFALECTLARAAASQAHLSVAQALKLGRASGARRVLLTHLSGASHRALSRAALRQGRELVARDLMRLRLRGT